MSEELECSVFSFQTYKYCPKVRKGCKNLLNGHGYTEKIYIYSFSIHICFSILSCLAKLIADV